MNERIAILGAGESGVQSAKLAKALGYDIFLSDASKIHPERKAELIEDEIPFEEGGHTKEKILHFDRIIKSPGIPPWNDLIIAAKEAGIPIISEIEFAAEHMQGANFIAITGSNGKTTTTSLTTHLLSVAGFDAVETGNIGTALARYALAWHHGIRHDVYVVELSSFQLEDMPTFTPEIAILLNITADHLDRYDYNIENYANAKGNVFKNLQAGSIAIYFAQDPETKKLLGRHPIGDQVECIPFFLEEDTAKESGFHYYSVLRDNAKSLSFLLPMGRFSISSDKLPLKGIHNMQNMMAAVTAAVSLGADPISVEQGLSSFKPVPHRMEPCGVIDGVAFINDSKATNIDATKHALTAVKDKDLVLILGGTDKGNDYLEIAEDIDRTCVALVFLTKDANKLEQELGNRGLAYTTVTTMEAAIDQALNYAKAKSAGTVLLSPCCASFDLFKNYVDRGDQFRNIVKAKVGDDQNI